MALLTASLAVAAFVLAPVEAVVNCVPGTYWHSHGSVDCGPAQGCPATGGTAAECCCACHADFYCPGGKKDQPEDACPAGTTSPPGSTSASDCTGGPAPPGPAPGGKCAPSQFFVNYLETPTSMQVSWATTCAATAVVKYGTSASALTSTATGPAPATYTFSGGYTSPYLYHTELTGLAPATVYYYTVGDATSGVSEVKNFTSSPGAALVKGFTWAIIGDLGQTVNSQSTVAHVLANSNVDAVMHVGDLSYADSVETRWDSWQELVAPLSERVPYMVQVGNHEDEKGGPFVAYAARFWMPAPAKGVDATWYSVEVGGVHWITLSNYHDFTSGSAQYNWLKADLAAIDRSITPWVLVNTHAPWYNSNTAHQGDGEAQRVALEKMLYDAGVDACFMGHVHAYERNHRVYNKQRDAAGPVYITIGDGGNREGLAASWLATPPYSAYHMATFGHGEIVVMNETHLAWNWRTNPDAESQTEDAIVIVKGQDI